MLEEFFWRLFIMGHLLPARRRAERRPEEAEEGAREGAREGRRPAAEQASAPLGGVGERVGESTPINGAEGSRRGWPASLGWWGWPAAAATASALYAAYHLSVLLLFLPLPYAILGAPAPLTRHPPLTARLFPPPSPAMLLTGSAAVCAQASSSSSATAASSSTSRAS